MSDGLSTGLAVAGFALAVISLTWQFWFTHRVDRARLRVTASSMNLVTGPAGSPATLTPVLVLTATNVGRRATVIQSVNLALGKRHRLRDVLPARFRPTYRMLPFADSDLPAINKRLPVRLEPGDEANIYVRQYWVDEALAADTDRRIYALASSSTAGTKRSRVIVVPPPVEQ